MFWSRLPSISMNRGTLYKVTLGILAGLVLAEAADKKEFEPVIRFMQDFARATIQCGMNNIVNLVGYYSVNPQTLGGYGPADICRATDGGTRTGMTPDRTTWIPQNK